MPQEQRGAGGSLSHGRKAPSRGEQPPVGGTGCQQGPFTQLLGISALLCQRSRGFWGIHIVEEVLPPTLALLYSSHPPPQAEPWGASGTPCSVGTSSPGPTSTPTAEKLFREVRFGFSRLRPPHFPGGPPVLSPTSPLHMRKEDNFDRVLEVGFPQPFSL